MGGQGVATTITTPQATPGAFAPFAHPQVRHGKWDFLKKKHLFSFAGQTFVPYI